MAVIKAFGKWETEKLDGNPYGRKGTLKVFLAEPKIPLILDTVGERIGFIVVRVASSNRFTLPKSNRTEEEKKRAVYYALYTPAEEWEILEGAYSPASDSATAELIQELIPPVSTKAPDPAQIETSGVNSQALRSIIAQSMDHAPYDSFPLTQRQMLEQAAYNMKISVEDYIETEIPPKRRQWAYERFGLDIQASA